MNLLSQYSGIRFKYINGYTRDQLVEKFYQGEIDLLHSVSIILTELDCFKRVNDTWGHQIGDEVLQTFATLLTTNTRECDLVSRWGGEEFLIICPETNVQGAFALAEHLRQIYSQRPFDSIDRQTASSSPG